MEYNVVLSLKSEQDIDEAFVWYEEKQVGLGLKFYREVRSSLNRLKTNAESFPVKLEDSIRELKLDVFPYIVVYEIVGLDVKVYRIFATAQNPNKKINS
jgi:plasmid stabilization system protein ParE